MAKEVINGVVTEMDDVQYTQEELNMFRAEELIARLRQGEQSFFEALEQWASNNATGTLQEMAIERIAIRNEIDTLGKVIQTDEGNGTVENPYKNWKVGMTVEEGKWYLTEGGYLWESIASGTPASETDRDYFDVVGM